MPDIAFRYEIRLDGVEPPIWRRIRVPATYTFWDLHVAIQDAMGWLDYHLHQFLVRNPENGAEERIGIPDEESFVDEELCLAGLGSTDRRILHQRKRHSHLRVRLR